MSWGRHSLAAQSPSTQVRYPWRAAVRTALAAGVAALIAFPDIVRVLKIEDLPGVAAIMAISLGLTRVFTLPKVDAWLKRFAPWLASSPPAHTKDDTDSPEPPADTHDER